MSMFCICWSMLLVIIFVYFSVLFVGSDVVLCNFSCR